MSNCHSRVGNFEFSKPDIEKACETGGLLSMEVEFSLRCNFHCPYCYVPDNAFLQHELTREEICDAILQAKDLGARRIIVLGGEPMVYPYTMEMIKFIRGHDLEVEMFTNGFNITDYTAKQLFDYKVNVVLKMNTFDRDLQDMLTGEKGSYKIIQDALVSLKQAGYPSGDAHLIVSTIICRLNIEELPKMWQWLRDQQIIPYFEMITPQGNAKENEWLHVDSKRVRDLFLDLEKIDREKYGYIWESQPPLVANKCLRHKFSCLLTSQGYIMPCVGINIPVGNIRQQKLKEIISESEAIEDLRNHKATIKGPCHSCEKADSCYGCRGAAYQLTGDYLASDPLCWHNIERLGQIRYLPTQTKDLIPQELPMRIVHRLLEVGDRRAKVETQVSHDMPFVSKDGLLDEVSYLELMAQAMAALHGFKQVDKSKSMLEGFLLGAKNIKIFKRVHVGDILTISVFKYARYGEFGIVKASIARDKDLVAEGEIKIWHK
ncbi:MAG: radical SAM protein [bacterium]